MTFDQAVSKLKELGCNPIMRMKYRMQEYALPEKYKIPASERPVPVDFKRHGLKEGALGEGEFWIAAGYDGYQAWREEICAPHWVSSARKQKAWREEHLIEQEWPDHGEQSNDPTHFINSNLGTLKWQFNASQEGPEKHREKLTKTLNELGKIGYEYLAEAIELALKTEPEHRQISKAQLLQNRPISPYVDKRITRMLELAFRAGRVSERHSTYYRGVPDAAQDGMPMVVNAGKGKKKFPRNSLKGLDKVLVDYMAMNPTFKNPALLSDMIKEKLVESRSHARQTHRFKDGTWVTKDAAYAKLTRLRKRYLR